jgi:outer membrane protein assembly factor BamA
VVFNFKDKKWWALSVGFVSDKEGGKTSTSFMFRNLRGKSDLTKLNLEYKHNTRTYGYEFSHSDPFFIMNKLETVLSLYSGSEEIDQNIIEHNLSGTYTFLDKTGKHRLSLGRVLRTNQIIAEKASAKLLADEIPVSAKNHVSYVYHVNETDDNNKPKNGYLLEI